MFAKWNAEKTGGDVKEDPDDPANMPPPDA